MDKKSNSLAYIQSCYEGVLSVSLGGLLTQRLQDLTDRPGAPEKDWRVLVFEHVETPVRRSRRPHGCTARRGFGELPGNQLAEVDFEELLELGGLLELVVSPHPGALRPVPKPGVDELIQCLLLTQLCQQYRLVPEADQRLGRLVIHQKVRLAALPVRGHSVLELEFGT